MTIESRADRLAARVVAVCVSPGGIPKTPRDQVAVSIDGLSGDGHAHEKHCRPDRAVSIQDVELLAEIRDEGFPIGPGSMGENLTVEGLNVQRMAVGDRLIFDDGPVLELSQVRKPCYVLDAIDSRLKEVVVGRCGFLARVIRSGSLCPGQGIAVRQAAT